MAEIAGGRYDSASKFAAAFKAVKVKRPWNTAGRDNKFFCPNGTGSAERSGKELFYQLQWLRLAKANRSHFF